MRRAVVISCAYVWLAGCSSGPTRPSPVDPLPAPPSEQAWTLTGQILNAQTQQPIAGAVLAPFNVVTDARGLFLVEGTGSRATQRVTFTASGYLPRETTISANRENPVVDLIPESAADLYRQLVRDGLDSDGRQFVQRWTSAPQFYISRSVGVTETDVQRARAGITAAMQQMSPFGAPSIMVGAPRDAQHGVVSVEFAEDIGATCGDAWVGANPGRVRLSLNPALNCGRSCPGSRITVETVAHEVAHALGFSHTSEGVMRSGVARQCESVHFSPAERDAARIAYTRPVGNADPDIDPLGLAFVGPPRSVIANPPAAAGPARP